MVCVVVASPQEGRRAAGLHIAFCGVALALAQLEALFSNVLDLPPEGSPQVRCWPSRRAAKIGPFASHL